MDDTMMVSFNWQRYEGNPVLPPGLESTYDAKRCMNPFVVCVDQQYRLYYSGGDAAGKQRICLATSSLERPNEFTRHGVILDVGTAGCFDAQWCVLPCVYRFGKKWHMYYSGHEGSNLGLQSFPGIGLATSDDGIHFERYASQPLITGDQLAAYPHNRGIAGGGSIIAETLAGGTARYRMYYTLAVGKKSSDVKVDQEKHCAVCHSTDGIVWTDHRLILSPRRTVANEDIAVAAPFVWRHGALYRMLYCGIGSRWGYYSISQAVSTDGYRWHCGTTDQNLSLTPAKDSLWEAQMVEYPCVIAEQNQLRLFYCGNGYGATGIGTAVSALGTKTITAL